MALNAPVDTRPAGSPPGRRLLDSLWFAASAPQVTIALTVLLSFTFALAALLPQLPAGSGPVATARWYSTTAATLGRLGPFFSSSGLLNVLDGPWIAALLIVIAFHLALRIARQAGHLLNRARGPAARPARSSVRTRATAHGAIRAAGPGGRARGPQVSLRARTVECAVRAGPSRRLFRTRVVDSSWPAADLPRPAAYHGRVVVEHCRGLAGA